MQFVSAFATRPILKGVSPAGAGWQKLADVVARTNARLEVITDAGYTTNRFYRLVVPRAP